jgi:hypothetical protein
VALGGTNDQFIGLIQQSKLYGMMLRHARVTDEVRAVAHFNWTVAIMATGVVISVLAALYIAQ